ncbi:unnamed protein product [Closterium sp. NIES-53]
MAIPEKRGGRGAGGSGEAQAQGQPRDSAMAPVQPSLGPPRDEPRVFGLDKFNGYNFAEWSFKMENIFDLYDLLEVMEGTEKRPENDPEKSPWMRKSAQGYLLLGQALGSSQIRHIKPFQHEPDKGPKAWAALKGVHASATAAVAVVLEQQMAALRIEEDKEVEEGMQKFFDLLTRLEGVDLKYSELQKKTKLLALLPESWSLRIINVNRDLPHLSLEDVKQAILQEDSAAVSWRVRMAPGQQASSGDMVVEGAEDHEEEGLEAATTMEATEVAAMAMSTRTMDAVADVRATVARSINVVVEALVVPEVPEKEREGDEEMGEPELVLRGAGGGRGRGRGGRGGRGGGAANMKNGDNEKKDDCFEEPAAVGKVTLHSLDYWVIDSGATYSVTPRADLLTELEPSLVKHVTSALGQRAELKGMGTAKFKGADGKMVGLKNVFWVSNLAANLISVRR